MKLKLISRLSMMNMLPRKYLSLVEKKEMILPLISSLNPQEMMMEALMSLINMLPIKYQSLLDHY